MSDVTKAAPGGAAVPQAAQDIAAASRARQLPIPAACEPGVAANLALLARHAAILLDRPAS